MQLQGLKVLAEFLAGHCGRFGLVELPKVYFLEKFGLLLSRLLYGFAGMMMSDHQ
jgi:hypothetical protein